MHLSDDQKNSHYISNTVINTIYEASTILINISPLEIYHIYFWLVNFSRKKNDNYHFMYNVPTLDLEPLWLPIWQGIMYPQQLTTLKIPEIFSQQTSIETT